MRIVQFMEFRAFHILPHVENSQSLPIVFMAAK